MGRARTLPSLQTMNLPLTTQHHFSPTLHFFVFPTTLNSTVFEEPLSGRLPKYTRFLLWASCWSGLCICHPQITGGDFCSRWNRTSPNPDCNCISYNGSDAFWVWPPSSPSQRCLRNHNPSFWCFQNRSFGARWGSNLQDMNGFSSSFWAWLTMWERLWFWEMGFLGVCYYFAKSA